MLGQTAAKLFWDRHLRKQMHTITCAFVQNGMTSIDGCRDILNSHIKQHGFESRDFEPFVNNLLKEDGE